MIDLYDCIGLVGVSMTMSNYARLQWQREYAKRMAYSLGNLIGSLLIVFSLFYKWNLPAFIVNCLIATISTYGVYRCMKYQWKAQNEAQTIPVVDKGCSAP